MSVSTHVDVEQFRNVIRSSVSITFDAECREHIGFDVRCHLRSEEKNKHKLVENVTHIQELSRTSGKKLGVPPPL